MKLKFTVRVKTQTRNTEKLLGCFNDIETQRERERESYGGCVKSTKYLPQILIMKYIFTVAIKNLTRNGEALLGSEMLKHYRDVLMILKQRERESNAGCVDSQNYFRKFEF